MHLVIDGYGGDVDKMWDQDLIRSFLDQFPAKLSMTPITEPKVLEYIGDKPDDVGVSGFVIIAESHISIHTFPKREYVNVDIFSCKGFDDLHALEEVKLLFGFADVKTWLLARGLEWIDAKQGLNEVDLQRNTLGSGGISIPRV